RHITEKRHYYSDGDIFPVFGKNYMMTTVPVLEHNDVTDIVLDDDRMVLRSIKGGRSDMAKKRALTEWYRTYLEDRATEVLRSCKQTLGYEKNVYLQVMNDTGTWFMNNYSTRTIWLNQDLVKLEEIFLEYAITSELVLFTIMDSGVSSKNVYDRYAKAMDEILPGWESLKDCLSSLKEL
ncbi:MAG: DUF45 domain-containing protein, partial [Eubacteriaceae bacterium]|nr:DUF45 domain-containing protein [Eubacteriaceae bacterium]